MLASDRVDEPPFTDATCIALRVDETGSAAGARPRSTRATDWTQVARSGDVRRLGACRRERPQQPTAASAARLGRGPAGRRRDAVRDPAAEAHPGRRPRRLLARAVRPERLAHPRRRRRRPLRDSSARNTWVQLDWLSDLAMAGAARRGRATRRCPGSTPRSGCCCSRPSTCPDEVAGRRAGRRVRRRRVVDRHVRQPRLPAADRSPSSCWPSPCWSGCASPARRGRTPWWLVGLSWVWACCHGLWFLGPLVGLVVVVGLALDRARPRAELLRLLAVPLLSVVARGPDPDRPPAARRCPSRSTPTPRW